MARKRAKTPLPATLPAAPLSFTVDGTPVGKQRPRLGRRGKVYTPAKTANYEFAVGWQARLAMGARELMTRDVAVTFAVFRKDARRVDLDNVIKSLLDAMNSIVYRDDSLVVSIQATLTRKAPTAYVSVTVWEI